MSPVEECFDLGSGSHHNHLSFPNRRVPHRRLLLPSAGSSDIDKSFQEMSGDVQTKAEYGWKARSDAWPVCLYLFDVPLKVPYDEEFTLPMFFNNSLSSSADSQEVE